MPSIPKKKKKYRVSGLGFKKGRGTSGRRRAFWEMAVRTAQTPGSGFWTGWSANLRATARISSADTGVGVGGVGLGGDGPVQETSDWPFDAIFGVANIGGARRPTGRRRRARWVGRKGDGVSVGAGGGSWRTRAAWWTER